MQSTEVQTKVRSYNLSARGLVVKVFFDKEAIVTIEDFPGDMDPLSIDRIRFGNVQRDVNGDAYCVGTNPMYSVTLSLIPGSTSDKRLCDYIANHIVSPKSGVLFSGQMLKSESGKDKFTQGLFRIEVKMPRIGDETIYRGGFFTGMTPGFSATSDGKVSTHAYTFEFTAKNY